MRVFIAVPCPADLSASMDAVACHLPATRWRVVAPAARHVTLRFLGEQTPESVVAAGRALASACRNTRAFSVEIRGVGAFPTVHRPEVVWAGGCSGVDRLTALAASLEAELAVAGFSPERRPLRVHLTVARRRPAAQPDQAAADVGALVERQAQLPLGVLPVAEVVLFRSDLGPGGARYTVLQQAALAPVSAERIP